MNKVMMLFISTLFFMSCKSPITISSAVKQTIIPGRPNIEQYNNYVINFLLERDASITLDSVEIFEGKEKFTTNFTLLKKSSTSYTRSIDQNGNYVFEASLRKSNIIKSSIETIEQNKLIVYYSENNQNQQLEIHNFKTDTITKR